LAVIVFFWFQGDRISAMVLAGVSFVAATGYRMGAIKALGLYGSLIVASLAARPLGSWCEPLCESLLGTNGLFSEIASMAIAGGVTLLVVITLTNVVSKWVTKDRPLINSINRWIGLGLGLVQGCLLVVIVLGGLLVLEPIAQQGMFGELTGNRRGSVLNCRELRESTLGRCVASWNPFERVPRLRRLQRSATPMQDASVLQEWANDSRGSSSLTSALQELAADPNMRALLESSRQQSSSRELRDNPLFRETLRSE
jgi:uncharacterized membrane protein required for colicin V production